MHVNEISGQIVDAAIHMHQTLGPGLLEKTYQACLAHELRKRSLHVETEKEAPLVYDGQHVDVGFRIDMLVADEVIVELKSVEHVLPIHEAQILTYLKLMKKRIGLLLNFNELRMKDGIHRFING